MERLCTTPPGHLFLHGQRGKAEAGPPDHGGASRRSSCGTEHLQQQLLTALKRLQIHLGAVIRDMPGSVRIPQPPSQRLIYEELLAVSDEFEDFEFDLRKQTLGVTSSDITLEGISFGRFRVLLDLTALNSYARYRVIAQAPNPSAARSNLTHPHVQDDHLCEGDAEGPLQCALRTGRLCDFFQIIQQTLQTYNGKSAYSALENIFHIAT